ncbi:hypothetical protein GCM10011273_08470 [Asticcacaulis endophyticus]|uniref:Uncharacterized protein n=1 Tax=Asticcacaulis endophyticus TaxID=1395890 RepID=A0A918PWM2_9CAUL|nr:hypothetical protein GCM10011273_08470 [Asticcacaulis endophyticus]
MIERVVVYVELLDEGTPVWRPSSAIKVDGNVFVLTNENHDPNTEQWSVLPGSLITIEQQQITDGSLGVATKYDEFAQ